MKRLFAGLLVWSFWATLQAQIFNERFANTTDLSNWVKVSDLGQRRLTHTPSNLRIQLQPADPPSEYLLRTKTVFRNSDMTMELRHDGFGRVTVGLWSVRKGRPFAWIALDTDDTDYLNFGVGNAFTEWKYSGTPHMKKWIKFRIRVAGEKIVLSAGGKKEVQVVPPQERGDTYFVFLSLTCAKWKSGENDTTVRRVQVKSQR